MIYSFSPFGYDGSIVTVEVDLRSGIPATYIVGLADSAVKETRGEYLLEELEEICKEVAKVCNGTYTHKETEVEIINKE